MNLEDLADLIRANSANTNQRIGQVADRLDTKIDSLRNETNAALMNLQNDLTDVKSDVAEVKRNLDLTSAVADMRKEIDALTAEVAELKRKSA